jgi:hypothetical protein
MALRPTSTCALGTVRFRTISIAGSARTASTGFAGMLNSAERASAAARFRSESATMSRIGNVFAALR